MKKAAKALEFEKAAGLRDQVIELRKALVSDTEALQRIAQSPGTKAWCRSPTRASQAAVACERSATNRGVVAPATAANRW